MSFLEEFNIKPDYLSREFDLIKPDLNRSVAGVFPELINHMSNDYFITRDDGFVRFPAFQKKLEASFPEGYDNLIFVICDAVGVDRLHALKGPLWENITSKGTIATTSFPSMTVTAMTTLCYGKHPSTHGMVGYCTYNEHLNTLYNGLNLKALDDDGEYIVTDRVSIENLVNGDPLIELVNANTDAEVTFFTPIEVIRPGLDDVIIPHLDRTDFKSPEEAINMVLQQLSKNGPQIIALYLPYTDHFGHQHGPESEEYTQALRGIEQIVGAISQHPKVQGGRTAIALTSDHGQSQIDHSISQWLERDQIEQYKSQGVTISTSGRVLHAYCGSDSMERGKEILEELGKGRGLVIDQATAIDLAGGNNTEQIRTRMGDFLLLMGDGYLVDVPEVVQYGEDVRLHGQHGSLTAKELYVPVGLFGGK